MTTGRALSVSPADFCVIDSTVGVPILHPPRFMRHYGLPQSPIFIMTDKQDAVSTADSGATSKDLSNNGIGGPKAIIKSVDMSDDLQQDSVDIATSALEKYNIEKDIAAQIKKEFDRRHGPTWHVVVGKNFGSYVTHGSCQDPLASGFGSDTSDPIRRNKTFYLLLHRLTRHSHLEIVERCSFSVACGSDLT